MNKEKKEAQNRKIKIFILRKYYQGYVIPNPFVFIFPYISTLHIHRSFTTQFLNYSVYI